MKKYTFISTLEFMAENEDDAYRQLEQYLADIEANGEILTDENWALDPLCEDD